MSEDEATAQRPGQDTPEPDTEAVHPAEQAESGQANHPADAETEEPEVIIVDAPAHDAPTDTAVGGPESESASDAGFSGRSFEEAAESELSDADRPGRRETFTVTGPLDIEVSITSGQITVDLVDEPMATVEVRHAPDSENPWLQGINNLMEWVNNRFGDVRGAAEQVAGEAVAETRVDLVGQRLVVSTPRRQLRLVPLAVIVRAPSGSALNLRSGSAEVTVTGAAGRCTIETGSGDIALDRADGYAVIGTGSGSLRLGPMLGGLKARSGSGEIEVSSVGGPTTVSTGSGDVWLGAVQDNVTAKTGSGDLTVADGACGTIDLITGSGEIRVGVRAGTSAQIDLSSGSGQARSELDVRDIPPAGSNAPRLRLRARTSSGNAVVTSAVG